MATLSAFSTGFDPGKPTCEFHWRRGVSWNIENLRELDEIMGEQWLLYHLQAIEEGKAVCGGCREPFATPHHAVLVTEWVRWWPDAEIRMVAYCLDCVRKYGEEIAGPSDHQLNA